MELVEGCEYVTIKQHALVMLDDSLLDWVPNDGRNIWGHPLKDTIVNKVVTQKSKSTRYLETPFVLQNKKPYFVRRRLKIRGVIADDLLLAGEREIFVWLDDLIFHTCIDGKLVANIIPKVIKPKWKKKPKIESTEELDDTNEFD
jgi:hypothetical protein